MSKLPQSRSSTRSRSSSRGESIAASAASGLHRRTRAGRLVKPTTRALTASQVRIRPGPFVHFGACGLIYALHREKRILHCFPFANGTSQLSPEIDLNVVEGFHLPTNLDGGDRVKIYKGEIALGSERFLCYGYTDESAPSNKAFMALKNVSFKGEVAVFSCGKVVSVLSRPRMKKETADKVALLFASHLQLASATVSPLKACI